LNANVEIRLKFKKSSFRQIFILLESFSLTDERWYKKE